MKNYTVYQYVEYEGSWDQAYFFSLDKANERHKDLQELRPREI